MSMTPRKNSYPNRSSNELGKCMKKSKSIHKLMVDFPDLDEDSTNKRKIMVKPPSLSTVSEYWTSTGFVSKKQMKLCSSDINDEDTWRIYSNNDTTIELDYNDPFNDISSRRFVAIKKWAGENLIGVDEVLQFSKIPSICSLRSSTDSYSNSSIHSNNES